MSIPEDPFPAGTPCWAELITADPGPARRFYAALFGWDQLPELTPEPNAYSVFYEEQAPEAGIGWLPAGPADTRLSPMWLVHFATKDVEAGVAAIREHGGSVVRPACDRPGLGRSAIVTDPAGAVFAITELRSPIGPNRRNGFGALVWNDLWSLDAEAARSFYAAVFGYTFLQSAKDPSYTTILLAESPDQPAETPDQVGGLVQIDPERDAETSSHWLVYLSLDQADADSAAVKAEWAGGRLQFGPYDSVAGRAVMLTDPQGALFTVIGGDGAARFS